MHAFATHLLSDSSTEGFWIDSTGNLSGETLKAIIYSKATLAKDATLALERAKITRVFDLHGVMEVIGEIETGHAQARVDSEGYSEKMEGVRLVIVDTITQPYSAMVNKNLLQGI